MTPDDECREAFESTWKRLNRWHDLYGNPFTLLENGQYSSQAHQIQYDLWCVAWEYQNARVVHSESALVESSKRIKELESQIENDSYEAAKANKYRD